MSALIIATNYGVEQDEIVKPLDALKNAGVAVTVAAPKLDPIETLVGDKDPGTTIEPNATLGDVDASEYDLLVIPGGTINADTLRTEEAAVDLVKAFSESGKTIAAICHAPWVLAEAGILNGKSLTSYPSLATDLRNAGATWEDVELQECVAEGWTLLTSRSPKDLDAFSNAVVEAAN
ncbi:type 1 glutamine amidotransferase domain-containing protein [Demequina aurantiaca]|uniref:type 1 glutamine amidotransferase domain-containing protein n=1 Tax=Demequina aurantiaca TaxID=676200 RepID=UPI000785451A|nr:type 1 glutamine amidotransferase domain-containing protein [Demequina aurantiaca]